MFEHAATKIWIAAAACSLLGLSAVVGGGPRSGATETAPSPRGLVPAESMGRVSIDIPSGSAIDGLLDAPWSAADIRGLDRLLLPDADRLYREPRVWIPAPPPRAGARLFEQGVLAPDLERVVFCDAAGDLHSVTLEDWLEAGVEARTSRQP